MKARACAVMHAPSLHFYCKRAPQDPESKEAFWQDPGNRDALQSDHDFQFSRDCTRDEGKYHFCAYFTTEAASIARWRIKQIAKEEAFW